MTLETSRFDIQNHLKSDEEQAAYLEAALEDADPTLIAAALGDIARARGATRFAEESGLSRETIYRAFRPGGNPTLDTVSKALKVLGLKLAVTPVQAAE